MWRTKANTQNSQFQATQNPWGGGRLLHLGFKAQTRAAIGARRREKRRAFKTRELAFEERYAPSSPPLREEEEREEKRRQCAAHFVTSPLSRSNEAALPRLLGSPHPERYDASPPFFLARKDEKNAMLRLEANFQR